MTPIYGFQSLLLVIGRFVWDVLAVPDPPLLLLYFFSLNNIIICLEISFSQGLGCRETGQLTSVDMIWVAAERYY